MSTQPSHRFIVLHPLPFITVLLAMPDTEQGHLVNVFLRQDEHWARRCAYGFVSPQRGGALYLRVPAIP